VVNSVFLRPLPYQQPDRLVRLSSTHTPQNLTRVGFSYPRFLEVRERQDVFSHLALVTFGAFTLTGKGDPEQIGALYASAEMLPALGLAPNPGRNFSADEDRPGGEAVALISPRFLERHFAGQSAGPEGPASKDPASSAIGQAITLDGRPYTIIGVPARSGRRVSAEPGRSLGASSCRRFRSSSRRSSTAGGYFFQVIARLKARRLVRPRAGSDERHRRRLSHRAFEQRRTAPSKSSSSRSSKTRSGRSASYLMLFGAVGCVLLIACANIANLLLARFAARRKEIAARFALGANRSDIVSQLVTESMMVAVAGGALGTAPRIPRPEGHRLDRMRT
jgi:hypothetical protein